MKVIFANEFKYEGTFDEHFRFFNEQLNFGILVKEVKLVYKDTGTVVFFRFNSLQPEIAYSYATSRKIREGKLRELDVDYTIRLS